MSDIPCEQSLLLPSPNGEKERRLCRIRVVLNLSMRGGCLETNDFPRLLSPKQNFRFQFVPRAYVRSLTKLVTRQVEKLLRSYVYYYPKNY